MSSVYKSWFVEIAFNLLICKLLCDDINYNTSVWFKLDISQVFRSSVKNQHDEQSAADAHRVASRVSTWRWMFNKSWGYIFTLKENCKHSNSLEQIYLGAENNSCFFYSDAEPQLGLRVVPETVCRSLSLFSAYLWKVESRSEICLVDGCQKLCRVQSTVVCKTLAIPFELLLSRTIRKARQTFAGFFVQRWRRPVRDWNGGKSMELRHISRW